MELYKLSKILENSTYPIEQELRKLNKSTQNSSLKTIISVTTVLFSGIVTSFIFENRCYLENCGIVKSLKEILPFKSLDTLLLAFLFAIYTLCIIINAITFLRNRYKDEPRAMKTKENGRKLLLESFHKSIVNDIVVGVSFDDKTCEEQKSEVKYMYLYEAAYYFSQAYYQIKEMELFDDQKKECNIELAETIGYETLMATLNVFHKAVCSVMNKIVKIPNFEEKMPEYKELKDISEKLALHINCIKILKDQGNLAVGKYS